MVHKWLWIGITGFLFLAAAVCAVIELLNAFFASSDHAASADIAGVVIFAIPAYIWGVISIGGFKARRENWSIQN
jgi:hypothetical protein